MCIGKALFAQLLRRPKISTSFSGALTVLMLILALGMALDIAPPHWGPPESLAAAVSRAKPSGEAGGQTGKTSQPPAPASRAPEPLSISRITPAGDDAPAGQQIVFEFNRPVVPLGRMERSPSEIPITIEPELACQWRWLNLSTLACQLDQKKSMKPSTRYRITVRPEIKAEDGSVLGKPVTHSFITQRPRVASHWFKEWLSPGGPQIAVRFNQPVREASVAGHLFFQTKSGARVAVKLEQMEKEPSKDDGSGRYNTVWIVTPAKELPQGEEVTLRLGQGTASALGPEPSPSDLDVITFSTFPPFQLVGISCTGNDGNDLTIPATATGSPPVRCNPSRVVSLLFSAPAGKDDLKEGLQIAPPIYAAGEEGDAWEDVYVYMNLREPHEKGKTYSIPLPYNTVKPFIEYQLKAQQSAIRDVFGRPLTQPINARFLTDHFPPDYTLMKSSSVLEKDLDTAPALLTTNIDKITLTYECLTAGGKTSKKTKTITVPRAMDDEIPIRLSVRSMLDAPSGIVRGNVATEPPVGGNSETESRFFAQVTPFHVHVKLGHRNSLAWVTDLQTGQPVEGVRVQICKEVPAELTPVPQVLGSGVTDSNGIATLPGTITIDPGIDLVHPSGPEAPRLTVRCTKDGDMALLLINYEFQMAAEGPDELIAGWLKSVYGHIKTWGATAQGIYKAGDTVQYKIYVRDEDNLHFTAAPRAEYRLKVMDPMDKVVHERKSINLSEFGAFDGEFSIPGNGAVGWYRFVLSSSFQNEEWEPMRVLVSDFTPSPFKVTTDLNGELFGVGSTVQASTQAKLHAGGPYTDARVRISAMIEPRPLMPQDPKARGFVFDVMNDPEGNRIESATIFQTEGKLDSRGTLDASFRISESPIIYGRLTVESAVQDDRGKSVANRASAAYVGRERYVGLSFSDWVIEAGKPAKVRTLVVDRNGHPAAGSSILIRVERRETKASRVKSAGSTYMTQYTHEWAQAEERMLTSGPDPLEIEFTPEKAGLYRIVARIGEEAPAGGAQGSTQIHETTIERYVLGKGHVIWEADEGNMLDVRPEKTEYRVGDTARLLVKNPFPGAKGLITVERLGVIQSWVKTFESSTELVEFPVLPDYLPGFYASVLVMSPRVEKPLSPDGVDLGKPAFRMGYVKLDVKDVYKELDVRIQPDREVYKPRDTVSLEIQAKPRQSSSGQESQPPIELAVAVLDDSVFDLLSKGREAFDPYRGFYHLDDLDLVNYNLLMQLVGRDRLEKKGANPGGGGGPDLGLRSLFKFVSYWNPSIRLGAEGKTRIQFQAPDNLTGWRVLAMAVTAEDRMGLGEQVFRVNQTTELRPVLPNQVTEGDTFEAGFTVMNRTEATRNIEVTIEARGLVEAVPAAQAGGGASGGPETAAGTGSGQASIVRKITADPFKRYTVRLPVKTTRYGELTFTARAGDEHDRDGMVQKLKVGLRQSPVTAATYGTVSEAGAATPITFPENMRTDVGGLSVSLSPTIIGGLEGSFRFAKDYPYTCWEQQITRALMAAWYQQLKPYLDSSFAWEGSGEAPAKMLALASEHQAPNGGMTYYVPNNEYVDPYLSAFTALAFAWLEPMGYRPSPAVRDKLSEYLQSLLKKDTVPEYYSAGMSWTVRAVALEALSLQSWNEGKGQPQEPAQPGDQKARSQAKPQGQTQAKTGITKDDIGRVASHAPEMSLFGKAMVLETLARTQGTEKQRKAIVDSMLAFADQSGGTYILSEPLDLRYKHILASSVRDNSEALCALLAHQAASPNSSALGDIPARLMRTISLSRKQRSHWQSTQDNTFAVRAAFEYSRAFESKPPAVAVQARLDQQPMGEARFDGVTAPPVVFERPFQPDDPGRKASLQLDRSGEGRVYFTAGLTYAPARLSAESVNAGIEVHREYSIERNGGWELVTDGAQIRTGDLLRVDLYVSAPGARHFVVVEDPAPGGFEPVNRQLATASVIDARKGEERYPQGSYRMRFDDWIEYARSRWSFYHRELRHTAARFYSEYLPPGRYHLSYISQAIAPGRFVALPTHAEEMYTPDVYGKSVRAELEVAPAE